MRTRLFGALLLALLCASCVTTGPAGSGTTATVSTKVDARIASVSDALAKECSILAVAIEVGRVFAKPAKVQKALAAAEAGRAEFCAEPPSDTNTAIATVAKMAMAVNVALNQP